MTPSGTTQRFAAGLPWRDLVLAMVMAAFTFVSAWDSIRNTPFGVAPDEWAHATYVDEIAAGGRLVPDYEGSRILPGKGRGNYLNHPPLYYTTLGLAGRAMGWDAVAAHRGYRALSALLVALGVALWILAGRTLGVPSLCLVACTAAANAIPMFPFLAGSINNDNMAYLGVAIAMYGCIQLRHWPRAAFYLAALGVVMVALSKATAAVFLFAFFAFWALPRLREASSPLRSRHLGYAVAAAGLACGAYYLPTLLIHGTPFPTAMELYPSNAAADPMPLGPFAVEFARQMVPRLPIITSHASLDPLAGGLHRVFWVMLSLPLLAWLVTRLRARDAEDVRMGSAFLLALATVVVVHLLVVWNLHREAGVVAGMQPRYYSYVLPGLFIFCALRCRDSRLVRLLFAGFALAAAILLAAGPALVARAQLRAQVAAEARAAAATSLRYTDSATMQLPAVIGVAVRNAGHLDAVTLQGRTATASGWAIDRADLAPARGVLVLVGDRVVGSAETGVHRPDVAQALKSPRSARAGFRFSISDLPAGTTECDIRLAAEQADGTLAILPHAACPQALHPATGSPRTP